MLWNARNGKPLGLIGSDLDSELIALVNNHNNLLHIKYCGHAESTHHRRGYSITCVLS